MSANSGSSFATLLLAMPLTAIALMGVFGVPQFASVIASPGREELIRRPDDSRNLQDPFDSAPVFGESESLNPRSSRDSGSEPPSRSAWSDRPESSSPPTWENAPPADEPSRPRWPNVAPIVPEQNSATSSQLDWRTASRRLTELGIQRYHLERGSTPDTFLFVCLLTPGDNPQVTHRFESENPDPLEAVNAVLVQVDQWLQQRYAQNAFPARGAMSAR